MPLTIKHQQVNKNTVKLVLSGQITGDTYELFDRQVAELIQKKIATIVLDLSNVDFISSAGVGAMIKAKMSMLRYYGELAMVNPQPQISKVFDIMKLLPAMNMFASVRELDDYLEKIQRRVVEGEAIYE